MPQTEIGCLHGATDHKSQLHQKQPQLFSNSDDCAACDAKVAENNKLQLLQTMELNMMDIHQALRSLMLHLADKDASNKAAREWRMVALVLDRIFFWCYLVVIITAGLGLLLPKQLSK